MKVTVIGDLHGREVWKEIVEKNPGSHFVFTGDYIDPYTTYEFIEDDEALDNFYDVLNFKRENPNSVTLLLGNHDAQYLFFPKYKTSAQVETQFLKEAIDLFKMNDNLFQFAIQKDKYLFIHAGISNSWLRQHRVTLDNLGLKPDLSNLAMIINKMGKNDMTRDLLLKVSYLRGGWELNGGPLWADKRELIKDSLKGFNQIVGHNKVEGIITIKNILETSITFCDCLWNKTESYSLNI